MHIGGNHTFPFGELFLTQACMFVGDGERHLIYTGNPADSSSRLERGRSTMPGQGVFLDMELIGRLHPLDAHFSLSAAISPWASTTP